MFNILLDKLPTKWKEYPIDTEFQIGIMISQCMVDDDLSDAERIYTAIDLLYKDKAIRPSSIEEAMEGINWFLNDWNHDNIPKGKKKNKQTPTMDFDVDQWRIYAAFKKQYGIDLNKESMHFWVFMGLLTSLEECNFTQVVSVRGKKITSKMSKEEKESIRNAKDIYRIKKTTDSVETEEEKAERQEAIDAFNKLRGKG